MRQSVLETGYGSDLWRGARLAFIADQMARLPRDIDLAALREAELKLHRSTTAAPVGTVDGSSWYAARLNRFLALGDTASVLQLEDLTGAASSDPYAARAIALAHLGRGAGDAACAIAAPKRGRAVMPIRWVFSCSFWYIANCAAENLKKPV